MSVLLYLAADEPLDELPNPHHHWCSVNEALAMGIHLSPGKLKQHPNRDEPGAVFWSDRSITYHIDTKSGKSWVEDGDYDDDFSIRSFEVYDDIYTEKAFTSELCIERWTEGRLTQLKDYLKWQLQYMEEVEFWHIFMGQGKLPVKRWQVSVDELTMGHVQWLLDGNALKHQYCLVLTK